MKECYLNTLLRKKVRVSLELWSYGITKGHIWPNTLLRKERCDKQDTLWAAESESCWGRHEEIPSTVRVEELTTNILLYHIFMNINKLENCKGFCFRKVCLISGLCLRKPDWFHINLHVCFSLHWLLSSYQHNCVHRPNPHHNAADICNNQHPSMVSAHSKVAFKRTSEH